MAAKRTSLERTLCGPVARAMIQINGTPDLPTRKQGARVCKLALLSNFGGRVYKGGLKRARISPDRGAWAKELTGALRPLEDSGPGRNRD